MSGLGQMVDASKYPSRGRCADACAYACFLKLGDAYRFVPYVADTCIAYCMDDSGCTDLPVDPNDFWRVVMDSEMKPVSVPAEPSPPLTSPETTPAPVPPPPPSPGTTPGHALPVAPPITDAGVTSPLARGPSLGVIALGLALAAGGVWFLLR